jgi:hypothetical protein
MTDTGGCSELTNSDGRQLKIRLFLQGWIEDKATEAGIGPVRDSAIHVPDLPRLQSHQPSWVASRVQVYEQPLPRNGVSSRIHTGRSVGNVFRSQPSRESAGRVFL